MKSHKRVSKKHFGSNKRSRCKKLANNQFGSSPHGIDSHFLSSTVNPSSTLFTSSDTSNTNNASDTFIKCPRCFTSVKDLNKHYAKNPLCAAIVNNDITLLTSSSNIKSLTRLSSSGPGATNNHLQSIGKPSETKINFYATNDIDEEMLYLPDDDSSKIDSPNNNCSKEIGNTNSPQMLSSLGRHYHVVSLKKILENMKSSNEGNISNPHVPCVLGDTIEDCSIDNCSTSYSDNEIQDTPSNIKNFAYNVEQLESSISLDVNTKEAATKVDEDTFSCRINSYRNTDDDSVQVLLYKEPLSNCAPDSHCNSDNNSSKTCTQNFIGDCEHVDNPKPVLGLQDNIVTNSIINMDLSVGLLDNFCDTQKKIAVSYSNLSINTGYISAIHLLKIMIDGNIAASRYNDLIKWHHHTVFGSMSHTNKNDLSTLFDVPLSKDGVITLCRNLVFNGSKKYTVSPLHSLIQLPSKKFCRISAFDFNSMVLSLLTDNELVHPSNMLVEDVNYLNPAFFAGQPDSTRYYGDIHTGSWFLHAHTKLCGSCPEDILCPIILFIDGTPIDAYGNLKLESVMFTLGIFNQETRNKSGAWRLLGYIPDTAQDLVLEENMSSEQVVEDEVISLDVQKRRDYHHTLKHIIQGIIDAENSNGILWNYVDSKQQLHCYRLKFALMYVIGDALGNDKLCDRFLSYKSSTKFICRDCNCPSNQLDDLTFICQYTERQTLRSLSEKDLKEKSYYKVTNNAFDYCTFGYDKYGINGCTPSELLHQFLLGVMKKLLDIFFDCITSKGLEVLDKIAKYLAVNWHRQSNKEFPDLQPFKDGIRKKKLSGDEIVAQAFIIYLALTQSYCLRTIVETEQKTKARFKTRKCSQGSSVSGTSSKKHFVFEKVYFKKIGQSLHSVKGWIKALEASLSFYAWLKQPQIPYDDLKLVEDKENPLLSSRNSKIDIAINSYLKLFKKVVMGSSPDSSWGMKEHQTTHIPHQIRRFGSSLNYDGGIGERHLKNLTKNPARLTQKRSSLLAQQATERYSERLCITRLHDILVMKNQLPRLKSSLQYVQSLSEKVDVHENMDNDDTLDSSDYYSTAGKYTYFLDDSGKFKTVSWDNRKHRKISHNEKLIEEVFARLRMSDYQIDCNHINCFTVLRTFSNGKQILFRADPYFFKKVWFDWCMTKWELESSTGSVESVDFYPARILMFIDPSEMVFRNNVTKSKGKFWAVIRCTKIDSSSTKSTGFHADTLLSDAYSREDEIRIISCQNIQSDAFVYPDIESIDSTGMKEKYIASRVFSIKPFTQWPKIFIDSKWI